jgi:hypothetical protein
MGRSMLRPMKSALERRGGILLAGGAVGPAHDVEMRVG